MRKIKFRQWRNKRFHYFGFTDGRCSGPVEVSLAEYPIDQFTGLRDKNGVDIYENDLIKIDGQVWPVIWGGHWNHAGFGFGGLRRNRLRWESEYCWDSLNEQTTKDCEVIGNVHENPDLLESAT